MDDDLIGKAWIEILEAAHPNGHDAADQLRIANAAFVAVQSNCLQVLRGGGSSENVLLSLGFAMKEVEQAQLRVSITARADLPSNDIRAVDMGFNDSRSLELHRRET